MKIKVRMQMEYKGAFWAGSFAQIFYYGVDFLLLWIVVTRFMNLAGWSSEEVIFLYAVKLISYGIAGTFFFHACHGLQNRVQSGGFDESLILPVNPLLFEVLSNCTTAYVRHIALSIVIFVVSFIRLEISLTFHILFWLIILILSAALIQAGFFLLFSAPIFWMIRGERVLSIFLHEMGGFVNYPINIYPITIQVILTFMIPHAFTNFYPGQFILGKEGVSSFGPVLQYLTPLVGIIVFLLGLWIWNRSIQYYQSTGS